MEEKKENNRPIFALRLAAAFSWWVLGFSITYHHRREDVRGVAGVAFATPFFQDLFYMPFRLLAIWSSGHPVIQTSGHPVFWPSDHLVIRPSGHLVIWSSRLLAI